MGSRKISGIEQLVDDATAELRRRSDRIAALEATIAKLEADLNTMSGIMREYAKGFFTVCEMLKAINAKMDANREMPNAD